MRPRVIVTLATGTVLGVSVCVALKSVDYRSYVSALCERMSADPVNDTDLVRDAFASTEVPEVVLTPGHTHPNAAAARNTGVRMADQIATYMGTGVFIVQMSRSDQRKGLRGTRQWYWTKDTNVQNRQDKPRENDVVYICDTDYYIDMPHMLTETVKPTLLYTAVPSAATTQDQDSTTFFNENGELVTMVSGGGRYEHSLWDYGSDSLMVTKTFAGIPYRAVTYAVERKQVSDHRQLILLAPIREFSGIAAALGSWLFGGNHLTRFNPIEHTNDGDSFVRFRVHRADGTYITTARPGSVLSCTIPASLDDAVANVARLGTTNLMMPTVASWLGKDKRAESTVLTEYHRKAVGRKIPTVFPLPTGVRAYQYRPETYDQSARPKLEPFMSPLVHGAFAPVSNAAGEERCVEGRINELKKPEPRPCSFRDQCLQEFITLVADGLVLEPVGYEVVAEKQTSPAQKLSLLKAAVSGMFTKRILKCFIKAEAYADVKDPRNISTYDDSVKLDMSMFALALSKHMKKFKWYAPGMTPVQVATRVAEICSESEMVNVSDLRRMDGTVSYWLRQVDRGVFMKTFVNHRAVMNELLKKNCDNIGFLPNGTSFQQGPSHGSGCPTTSLSQTLRAAFCSYLAYRHTKKPNGVYYSASEAFAKLGIHSGDDGLDGDLPVESHEWAAKKVGLVLEANTISRGFPGINFLARYYSEDVWNGRLDSMCDVKRQLSKFHTTVRLPDNILAEFKLVEKAMAFVATDGNTPVIGPLCKRVLVLSEYRPKTSHGIANWWARFDQSEQFPNNNADGWMDVEFYRQFPEFDHRIFDEWLVTTRNATQILEAPLCAEPRPATPAAVDVVVDDDILLARESPAESAHTQQPPTEVSQEGSPERVSQRKHKRKSGKTRADRRKTRR